MADRKVYCVRDVETGKILYDHSSFKRVYYSRFAFAENASYRHKKRTANAENRKLEIVEFRLEETACWEV